jgi:catechol 2,3-dioxygenase-like lactoylglutathione lyase family enzyme
MKFRFARHTNQLEKLVDFYVQIMGLHQLGEFKDHAGYEGVFIGKSGADWHLEFTQTTEPAKHTFDEDDLLVFYLGSVAYDHLTEQISRGEIVPVKAKNPYWEENGITLLDPDGFRIVISKIKNDSDND